MRIFQILEKNEFNTGSVHQMFQAAVGLKERGHDLTIVSRPGEQLASAAREAGIDFRAFPFKSEIDITTIRGISRLAGEKHPDVIHVHKGRSHTLAMAATWRKPVAAFIVNRGVSFALTVFNRAKYRTARVDRVVTVCQQIKDVIVETGKLPDEKVQVIFAGTDVDLFDPAKWNRNEFRDEKGIGRDRYLITQVGVRDWKGWREVIDSAADVAQRVPNVHVALIAYKSEHDAQEIRDYAAKAGIGDKVTPVEARRDMPRIFAASDLVTDASWAGTGITGTIREAMAMQKPTISTDCGGNVELVTSPDVGWLVPAKDRAALTKAMLEAIENPQRSAEVGVKAREHVVRGYSKTIRIDRLEALYSEIVSLKGKKA